MPVKADVDWSKTAFIAVPIGVTALSWYRYLNNQEQLDWFVVSDNIALKSVQCSSRFSFLEIKKAQLDGLGLESDFGGGDRFRFSSCYWLRWTFDL